MNTKYKPTLADLPKTYADLVALCPPRPIHSKAAYERTVMFIDAMAGHALNADQEDYLEALTLMVERYETDRLQARLASVRPADVVRHLMEANALSVSALGQVVGSQPLASLILSGKRAISRVVALRLAKYFAVNPGLFLADPNTKRKAG